MDSSQRTEYSRTVGISCPFNCMRVKVDKFQVQVSTPDHRLMDSNQSEELNIPQHLE